MLDRRSTTALLAWLVVSAAVLAIGGPGCGGAIDDGELYKKGGTSGSSGTTTPLPTAPVPTTQPAPGPPPVPKPSPTGKCGVSYQKDVFDVFDRYDCSNINCHGGSDPKSLPRIDRKDTASTYKALLGYMMSNGLPYVAAGSTSPTASGIYCNLRAICGTPMPINDKVAPEDLDVISAWLSCGAPLN